MPIAFSRHHFGLVAGLSLAFGVSGFAEAAEPLQLTCEGRDDNARTANFQSSVKVRIDFDNKIVELLQPTGFVMASTTDRKMDALTPSVQITDTVIVWNLSNSIGVIFRGLIDRETGDTDALWFGPEGTYVGAPNVVFLFRGRCRRATQKF
jgi:hypothetical protein